MIFRKEYEAGASSICSFLKPPVIFPFFITSYKNVKLNLRQWPTWCTNF
jgi:hypothetical protein